MRKISRIGATALALALSVAFLIPTQVYAANEKDNDRTQLIGLGNQKSNDTYDSDLIITDVRKIAEFATEAEANNAYSAAGYTPAGGYSVQQWERGGLPVYVIIQTTYKNQITGATSVKKADVSPEATGEIGFTKTVYVPKGEIITLNVLLSNGGINIKNIKSSNKNVFTAKIDKENVIRTETNENAFLEKDAAGNWCYYSSSGNKIIIPKNADGSANKDSIEYKNSNSSRAVIGIKLTAIKTGTANLKFNIVDRNGTRSPMTVKVVVREDDNPYKTFTYSGVSLIQKRYGDSSYVDNGRIVGASNNGFIHNGKGKLIVKANKGYKIMKIEVGKLSEKDRTGVNNRDDGTYQNIDNAKETATGSITSTYCPIDLNGDGDFLDIVGGISENNPASAFHYKQVKSGKTIKLSTVAPYIDGYEQYAAKALVNKNGEKLSGKITMKLKKKLAPTAIRVTYYDRINRKYVVDVKYIKTLAVRDDD